MVNLHLTLAHSKGQSQGHTNVDCNYLVPCDILPLPKQEVAYWLFIVTWSNLKVKVRVVQILTMIISKTVTGRESSRTNIAIQNGFD